MTLTTELQGGKAPVIIDAHGGSVASDLISFLDAAGTLVVFGDLSQETLQLSTFDFLDAEYRIQGVGSAGV